MAHEPEVALALVSVHVELVKVPPATLAPHDMEPVGVADVPVLVSVTVAVNVIVFPIVTDEGLGDKLVLVIRRLTVSDDVLKPPA